MKFSTEFQKCFNFKCVASRALIGRHICEWKHHKLSSHWLSKCVDSEAKTSNIEPKLTIGSNGSHCICEPLQEIILNVWWGLSSYEYMTRICRLPLPHHMVFNEKILFCRTNANHMFIFFCVQIRDKTNEDYWRLIRTHFELISIRVGLKILAKKKHQNKTSFAII